jgi:ABC-type amino acid transport substrate-binding protein
VLLPRLPTCSLLLALWLPLPASCQSAADQVVLRTRMETDAELKWRPDGQSGLCPEILQAIMRRAPELKIEWPGQAVPQRRLVAQLDQGVLDLACALGRTPERERSFTIPDVVLYHDQLLAAVRAGDGLKLTGLRDLAALPPGDVVLVNSGARLVQRLRELGVTQVDEGGRRPEENLRKLALKRGRVFLYHEPGMHWEIYRAGLARELQVLPTVLSSDPHYLLLSRRLPPATVLRLTEALRQLRDDGSLHGIAARWSHPNGQRP